MKKILIVDDIPQNLYLLEVLLKTNGYEVIKASNGVEALELARKDLPDVLVTDILMPSMDGFSLCRAWYADDNLKGIPFVFYTATYTDPKDVDFALSLGAERFIIKPTEPDEFIAIIKEVLESNESKKQIDQPEPVEKVDGFYKEYNEVLIRKLEKKMMQLQQSNKRLASLYQASCDLHVLKPSMDLIRVILNTIVEDAGYQQANYFDFDEKKNKLFLLASVGFSQNNIAELKEKLVFDLSEEHGLINSVVKDEQIINIADISKEPRWNFLDQDIKSVLFTPVHFERKFLGVIVLFSKEKDHFNESDEHDIAILANNLAVAIMNNRNQERVKSQLTRMSALHDIDVAISSSMDLQVTLNILLDHVITQLKCDAADVLLSRSNTYNNEFVAGRGFNSKLIENNALREGKSLDKKVISDRNMLKINELSGLLVSSGFLDMWNKEGFLKYFGVPLISKGNVVGVLEVFHRTKFYADSEWIDYLNTLAGQAAIAVDNAKLFNDLQRTNIELSIAYDATIRGWSRAMDMRDHETEGHTQRVAEVTVRLARNMGIEEEQIVHMQRGALLHDIGKLGVPDSILLKADKLTDEEWTILRKHPDFAHDMLLPINYLNPALDIPYYHHEKWDGTGYPCGLKGEQIPLAARIFAIVDVWDALRSDRPYRKAWPDEKVNDYLREQSGKHFDPKVVSAFFELKKL